MEQEKYIGAEQSRSLFEYKNTSDVKKGHCVMLKNNPCKIISIHISKPGKHGDAKYHFVGKNILNGNKCEEIVTSHKKIIYPFINTCIGKIISIENDGFISLMDEKTMKITENLKINENMMEKINQNLEKDIEIYVKVLNVMDQEKIIEYKFTNLNI